MPILIEKTLPSKKQLVAVYAYIYRKREKGKQALAESRAREQEEKERRREKEKQRKTVDDVRKEVTELETKLHQLKREKHELFLQFKKALNEDEMKKQRESQIIASGQRPFIGFQVEACRRLASLPQNISTSSRMMDSLSDSGFRQLQTVHAHNILPSTQVQLPSQEQIAGFKYATVQTGLVTSCQDPQQPLSSWHLEREPQEKKQYTHSIPLQQQGFKQFFQFGHNKQPIQQLTNTEQQTSREQVQFHSYQTHNVFQHQQPYWVPLHEEAFQTSASASYQGYHSQQAGQAYDVAHTRGGTHMASTSRSNKQTTASDSSEVC